MKIITDPEKLRMKCRPITRDTNMGKLFNKIREASRLMTNNNGCGLAATQVGVDRLFFLAIVPDENGNDKIKAFLNPTIVAHSEETNDDIEGCLSFPNKFGTVTRWNEITLRYMLSNYSYKTETFTGLPARIIQHEYDHLKGILCMDIARDVYIKKPEAVVE